MSNSKSGEESDPEDHGNQHDAVISPLTPPERNIPTDRQIGQDQDAWPAEGDGEREGPAAVIAKEQRKKHPTHGASADIRRPLILLRQLTVQW